MIDWVELLRDRGIYVEKGRHVPKAQALIDVVLRENHIPCNKKGKESPKKIDIMEPFSEEITPPPKSLKHFIHPDRRQKVDHNIDEDRDSMDEHKVEVPEWLLSDDKGRKPPEKLPWL